jgi:hypothetical protein
VAAAPVAGAATPRTTAAPARPLRSSTSGAGAHGGGEREHEHESEGHDD